MNIFCLRRGGPSGPPRAALKVGPYMVIVFVLIAAQAWAASWRMHRGFSERTGRALEEASPPLTQAWSVYVAGPVFASPVVAGDKVLVATENGDVVALSEAGAELWRTNLGAAIRSTPAVRDGRVYVVATNGRLTVLNLAAGTVVYGV
ncbi:MAG: PQQ-binding-like beta-propeller repeat protein, partial [bacterium]